MPSNPPEPARDALGRSVSVVWLIVGLIVICSFFACCLGVAGWIGWTVLHKETLQSQEDIAESQIRGSLTHACEAYRIKHGGEFPQILAQLTQRDALGGPYLESPDALTDPWGHPYQYDASGPKNNGTKPDIWTVVPNSNPQKKVGNWPKQK
jgi:hypothetical protein